MRTLQPAAGVLPVATADAAAQSGPVRVVTLVALADDGMPQVTLDASQPPVTARLAMQVTRPRLELAIAERQPVVVLIDHTAPSSPLLIGCLEQVATESAVAIEPPSVVEADVDGRRVRVTAQDEIVLQCGQASITLRRNGRVIVRGTYVETHSDGTNRIKGGQVQIN